MENRKHYIILHCVIFIWGFTGIMGKLIEADEFLIVLYRVLIAFVSLFAFMLFLKKDRRILSAKTTWQTLGVGILVALHWFTFYTSIKLSTASLAIICLSTASLHVAWIEPLVMKRKFRWSEMVIGLVIIGGIFLIVKDSSSTAEYEAIVYGLFSALFAALFSSFNGKLATKEKASKITLYEMFSGLITMLILIGFTQDVSLEYFVVSWNDVWWLLFLGIICTSVAFLLTVEVTKHLGAFTVAMSINMEPIYTLGIAAVLLSENKELSLTFYLGAAIIVAAIFMNGFLNKKRRKRQTSAINPDLLNQPVES